MKKEIKTWKNLEAAFAGESMAYQKYLYFAKIARKNGDEDIAKLFEETARHETAHAQGHLTNLYPMKEMSTEKCLQLAMEGERFEYTEMYPQYAKEAREEGADKALIEEFVEGEQECKEHAEIFEKRLKKMNKIFDGLTKVEKEHHDNYQRTLDNFQSAKEASFKDSDDFLEAE